MIRIKSRATPVNKRKSARTFKRKKNPFVCDYKPHLQKNKITREYLYWSNWLIHPESSGEADHYTQNTLLFKNKNIQNSEIGMKKMW